MSRSKVLLRALGLALTIGNIEKIEDHQKTNSPIFGGTTKQDYSAPTRNRSGKCAKHFENKKKKNRKRAKAARRSRQINRV